MIIAGDGQRIPLARLDLSAGDIVPNRERRRQINAIALMDRPNGDRNDAAYAVIEALHDAGFRIVRARRP